MNMDWKLYPGNRYLPSNTTGKRKFCIYQDMERYGDKLKSSSSMTKFCCITDLIRFMIKEAEKLVRGSVHEENLFIVHDDLVMMTEKETIIWMRERKNFQR